MNLAFVALGVCATTLGVGRLSRLRDDPATLTQKAIIVSLLSTGVGALAYGTRLSTAPLYDIGGAIWHMAATVLIGALEITFLTLRVKEVKTETVRRISVTSGILCLLILISWPAGQARGGHPQAVDSLKDHNFPSLVTLLIFPIYVIWGLSQIVLLGIRRVPQDFRRRPINTLALAMVSVGALGFIGINVATAIYLNSGRAGESEAAIAFSPIALGAALVGAALLATGERIYEEAYARYQIFRLGPLWKRLDELSGGEFNLPSRTLSTPARLQRAYVEISDAICTLRVDTGSRYDLNSVAASLHRGNTTDDRSTHTLSRALPERRTRREDLEAIHALAKAYRSYRRGVEKSPAARVAP